MVQSDNKTDYESIFLTGEAGSTGNQHYLEIPSPDAEIEEQNAFVLEDNGRVSNLEISATHPTYIVVRSVALAQIQLELGDEGIVTFFTETNPNFDGDAELEDFTTETQQYVIDGFEEFGDFDSPVFATGAQGAIQVELIEVLEDSPANYQSTVNLTLHEHRI